MTVLLACWEMPVRKEGGWEVISGNMGGSDFVSYSCHNIISRTGGHEATEISSLMVAEV